DRMDNLIGETFHGWTIKRYSKHSATIKSGGMAVLYYAENGIGKKAAIKVLHAKYFNNRNARERFRREAQALVRLDHPNIVRIYDMIESSEFMGLIMEYLDGADLKEYIETGKKGGISEAALKPILVQVMNALTFSHKNEIYHRDLKPSNIFLTNRGEVKLIDFGIAKSLSYGDTGTLTATEQMIGTPMYNFSVPSILKAFIDNVVRIGRTFVSDAQGYRGLLGEKKLILVNTRGADFTLDHFKAMDHLGPYIKSIFAFMGLHDIEWVDVHPVQYFGEEAKLAAIARAKKQIDALAIRLGQSANQLLGE
ncbi:MAG: NAD(P)H-dependent oxidoreductase, partial [Bacteroidota bacterium]